MSIAIAIFMSISISIFMTISMMCVRSSVCSSVCARARACGGGVSGDFLKSGASSIGLVAPLFPPDAVLNAKWDVIQANAAKVIGNVKAAIA